MPTTCSSSLHRATAPVVSALLSAARGNEDVLAPSDTLQCDVVIGSALIYSPHHACVGDVLARAFAKGGCGAAHIVQLSTR